MKSRRTFLKQGAFSTSALCLTTTYLSAEDTSQVTWAIDRSDCYMPYVDDLGQPVLSDTEPTQQALNDAKSEIQGNQGKLLMLFNTGGAEDNQKDSSSPDWVETEEYTPIGPIQALRGRNALGQHYIQISARKMRKVILTK